MSDFKKVSLKEYAAVLFSPAGRLEDRQVVIIAESKEAADVQLAKFAAHLNAAEGTTFTHNLIRRLDNFHVTFTEAAWEQLKASDVQ